MEEQLESLINQVGVETTILVRDDGSTDGTHAILNRWQDKGLLTWYTGENLKPAQSFLQLLQDAPSADYYAFCDQDDVWLRDKLKSAVDKISDCSSPALYLSVTKNVDKNLNELRQSHRTFNYTLGEAIITNPSTGCTNVLNNALRKIIVSSLPNYISMHDSWVYQACLMIGGYIYHDKESHILYRQHENNVIGSSSTLGQKIKRKLALLDGRAGCERSKTANELLNAFGGMTSLNDRALLRDLSDYKTDLFAKYRLISSGRLRSSCFKLNLKAKIAILLNRF